MATQDPPELDEIFSSCEKIINEAKVERNVKILQAKIKEANKLCREAKRIIRDFEKSGDKDEAGDVAHEKTREILVRKLNRFIGEIKTLKQNSAKETMSGDDNEPNAPDEFVRGEDSDSHFTPPKSAKQRQMEMTNDELMEEGRHILSMTDETLNRQRRIVQDTVQVATTTAETLQTQTEQLNKIDDDLEQIKYSLKGSKKLLISMSRGVATNKITMCLLCLIILGVVGIIVLSVLDNDDDDEETNTLSEGGLDE